MKKREDVRNASTDQPSPVASAGKGSARSFIAMLAGMAMAFVVAERPASAFTMDRGSSPSLPEIAADQALGGTGHKDQPLPTLGQAKSDLANAVMNGGKGVALSYRVEISSAPSSWQRIFVYDATGALSDTIENSAASPITAFWTEFANGATATFVGDIPDGEEFKAHITRMAVSGEVGTGDAVPDGVPEFLSTKQAGSTVSFTQFYRSVGHILIDENPEVLGTSNPIPVAYCTGTLVTEDILLTAGHCLEFKPELCNRVAVTFGLDPTAGEPLLSRQCKKVAYLSKNLDFAFLELSPVAEKFATPALAARKPVRNEKLVVVQYPQGVFRRVSNDARCKVTKAVSQISRKNVSARSPVTDKAGFDHFCDTAKGSSGAPVFTEQGEILGIQQAGMDFGSDPRNVAIRSDFIASCISINVASNSVTPVPNAPPVCK